MPLLLRQKENNPKILMSNCYLVAGRRFTLHFPDDADNDLPDDETVALPADKPTDFMPPSYRPFRCNPNAGEPLFELTLGVKDAPVSGEWRHTLGLPTVVCRLFATTEGYAATLTDTRSHRTVLLRSDPVWSHVTTTLQPCDEGDWLLLDFILMMVYGFAAPRTGAMLMHASAVSIDGRTLLFLGASGTGKSTHASLWLRHIVGASLLNDDNPVVSFLPNGQPVVSGSPWSGKTPCYIDRTEALAAFVRLTQAPSNRLTLLHGGKAYAAILPSVADMPWDKAIHTATCALVARLATALSVARLDCLPDQEAVLLAHSLLTPTAAKEEQP